MKHYLLSAVVSVALATVPHFATASSESATSFQVAEATGDHGAMKAERKAKWDAMSPEEKAAAKEHMKERKAKWDAMSPEEKAAHKAKKAERKAKWDAMSPEEKAAAKQRMKERKAKWESMSPEERAAAKEKWKSRHHVPNDKMSIGTKSSSPIN